VDAQTADLRHSETDEGAEQDRQPAAAPRWVDGGRDGQAEGEWSSSEALASAEPRDPLERHGTPKELQRAGRAGRWYVKEIAMTKRKLLALAIATTALTGTFMGTMAGPAAAKSRCERIWDAMNDSLEMAAWAYDRGDYADMEDWIDTYNIASRNYKRLCRG
jgi:hypothetical protein